jgi:chromosome segregation ATPase
VVRAGTTRFGYLRIAMRRLGIALVVAATISGCGGDKDVTRADYIAEASKGCKEFIAKGKASVNRLQDLLDGAHSQVEFLAKAVPLLEEGLEDQRDQLAKLRKIEPPQADRGQIDKLLAESEKRNDELEGVVDAARARDAERYATLAEELRETEHRVREMAGDYGLDHC